MNQTHHPTRPRSHAALLAAALACAVPLADAPAQVVVTKGKSAVHIEPFSGPNAAEAAKVLEADLKRSGYVEIVEAARAQYRASGVATAGAVKGAFRDARDNRALVEQNYAASLRQAVHRFADDIVRELSGAPGIATTRVAFIAKKAGHKELFVMDLDGEGAKQVTADKVISAGPSFAPDGSRIAYTSYKSGYPDIYTVDLASGARTRVASFPGLNSGAAFSPKGDLIAMTLSFQGNPEIYFMAAAGGGKPTRVTKSRGTDSSPCWSPDGDRLVYVSDDRGSPQLYLAAMNGTAPERLNTGVLYATEPAWSPDGKAIAFNARVGGAFQIYLYDVATKQSRQATSIGNNEDPSWCRDSRHLVFSRLGRLVLLDTVSGETHELPNGLADCTEPSCSQ